MEEPLLPVLIAGQVGLIVYGGGLWRHGVGLPVIEVILGPDLLGCLLLSEQLRVIFLLAGFSQSSGLITVSNPRPAIADTILDTLARASG